jgi:hypothetical protein
MRRLTLAGLLALPAVLFFESSAQAQCTGPGCSPIPAGISNPFASCKYLGCGGFCFRLFPGLHQEGPLFNYGPYYGYYPFEPYGPWTSDLKYTGPTGAADCGSGGCGGGWGHYAKSTLSNIRHRVHPFHKGCSTCGGEVAAGEQVISEPAAQAAVESPILQAGYPRRER